MIQAVLGLQVFLQALNLGKVALAGVTGNLLGVRFGFTEGGQERLVQQKLNVLGPVISAGGAASARNFLLVFGVPWVNALEDAEATEIS